MRIIGIDLATTAKHRAIIADGRSQFISPLIKFDTRLADLERLREMVAGFPAMFQRQLEFWRGRLGELKAAGKTAVIWGSGSKGVSFLTTLGLDDGIAGAVDINPHRQGYFMPGTGHRIFGPADLVDLKPDVVIVMNPIYKDEIAADLAAARR